MPTSNNPIKFIPCSKSSYDNLQTKNDDTLYFITDEHKIFVGQNEYTKSLEVLAEAPTSSTAGVDGKLYYYPENHSLYMVNKVNSNLYSWNQVSNFVDISNLEVAQTSIPEVRTTQYHSQYIPDLTDPIFTNLAIGQYFWFEPGETPHFCVKTASDDWKYAWWEEYYISSLDIPTATSELTNDSGFLTSHQDISGKVDKTQTIAGIALSGNISSAALAEAMAGNINPVGVVPDTTLGYGAQFGKTSTGKPVMHTLGTSWEELALASDLASKEDIDNKVSGISAENISSTTQYVTPKAVADFARETYATPEMYGAVGDGLTDDTAAITACLNANCNVIFTRMYAVNTIANTNGTEKYGLSIPSDRTLKFCENSGLICIPNQSNIYNPIRILNVENITIDGMILQCDRSNEVYLKINGPHPTDKGNGVLILGSKNITLKNCEIFDALGDGVGIWHSGDDSTPDAYTISENILIENCCIHNNRRNGISIGSTNNIRIKDCTIYDNGLNVSYPNSYNVPADNNYGLVVDGDNVIAPGISPRAGIDIEPNYSHNTVDEILVESTVFYGNGGFDFVDTAVGSHSGLSLVNCTSKGGSALNSNGGVYLGNADTIVTGGRYCSIGVGSEPNVIVDHAIINKVISASTVKGKFKLCSCDIIGSNDFAGTFSNGGANCLIECDDCFLQNGIQSNMANTGTLILYNCRVKQSDGQFLSNGYLFADGVEFDFKGNLATQIIRVKNAQFTDCDLYYEDNSSLLHIDETSTTYTWFNNRFYNTPASLSPKSDNLVNNWFNFPSTKLAGSATGYRIGNIWSDKEDTDTYTKQQIDTFLTSKMGLAPVRSTIDDDTQIKQGQFIVVGGEVWIKTAALGSAGHTTLAEKATTLSGYGITDAYTKTQVDGMIPTVPTNVSAFTNDSGYLTLATLPIYNGGVQ